MRANALGARGELSAPGAAFRTRGEVILGSGPFCASDFLIEIRAECSII